MACGCNSKTQAASKGVTTWPGIGVGVPCTICKKTYCCNQCCSTNVQPSCSTPKEMCPSAPGTAPKFKYSLKVFNSFNMPACGIAVEMSVGPNVLWVQQGSVLWNHSVGYLHVISFSVDRQTVTAENLCEQQNVLAPGEAIPACTEFVVSAPAPGTVGAQSGTGPYLAADMTAQGEGVCWLIQVTTVDGLSINDSVGIKGYIYRVSEIPTLSTVRICDDGDGAPSGTLVEADPGNDGVLDLPIIRLGGSDPCTKTATNKGLLLVCDGGQTVPMAGTIDGHFPRWNAYYGRFDLAVFPSSLISQCTTLVGCCLTLNPADTGCYLIKVESTVPFSTSLFSPVMIEINNEPYCICSIVDAEYMNVKPLFDVTEIREIDGGALICLAECCNQCRPTVETLGRFNEAPEGYRELIISVDASVNVPATSTYVLMIPNSIAYTDAGIDQGLWALDFNNANSLDFCNKVIEVHSNFELAVNMPANVFANVDYRLVKGGATANSQSRAAIPMTGGRANLATLANTPNLLIIDPSFKNINTFAGYIMDRGFVQGECADWDASNDVSVAHWNGHVRVTFENTTASVAAVSVRGSVRAWFDVQKGAIVLNG